MRHPVRSKALAAAFAAAFWILAAGSGVAFRDDSLVAAGEAFDRWVARLWADARKAGISKSTFDRAFHGVTPDPDVITAAEQQPEFVKPIWDYLDRATSPERIANGRAKLAEHAGDLAAIEKTYGVDRHVLTAIWGVESAYGTSKGELGVVRSLATLAFQGTRQDFGRTQLVAALQILERGDVAPEAMLGSWAGAMGHTQFIPTTYNSFAVDHNRDGRRDIWTTPGDALASAANYLARSGWVPGEPWGYEVTLPDGFNFAEANPSVRKPITEWLARGVRRADGRKFEAWATEGAIVLPAGARGPAFLVFRNFRTVLRYNNAIAYALAVCHLADRIRGGAALVAGWPKDELPLTEPQRRELQELLAAKGFYKGGVDGLIGSGTQDAIRSYQHRVGLEPDGYPSAGLLERLRRDG